MRKTLLSAVASKHYMYIKKKNYLPLLEDVFVITIQNLQKIAMITYKNTKRCTAGFAKNATVQIKKKVTKNRNQNALKI